MPLLGTHRAMATCLGGALLLCAAPATAAQSAQLVYVRGAGAQQCGDDSLVRREVSARMGYDPFVASARVTVILQIEGNRSSAGYGGRVQVVDEKGLIRGERQLSSRSSDCLEVLRAAALAISLALDLLPESEPKSEPAAAPASDSAGSNELPDSSRAQAAMTGTGKDALESANGDGRPPSIPADRRTSTRAEDAYRFELTAALGARTGFAPTMQPHAGIAAAVRKRWWSVGIEGTTTFASSDEALSPRGSFTTSALLGAVVPCVRYAPFLGCVVGTIGRYRAESSGVRRGASDDALYIGAALRGGAELEATDTLFGRVAFDVGVPLRKHVVEFGGARSFELSPVFAAAALEIGARF